MAEISETAVSDVTVQGAVIQSVYVTRKSKVYALYDTEVETLSALSDDETTAYSVSSFLCAAAIGILTNFAFAEKLTPEGNLLSKVGAPLLLVGSVFYLWRARGFASRRKASWTRIKEESESAR